MYCCGEEHRTQQCLHHLSVTLQLLKEFLHCHETHVWANPGLHGHSPRLHLSLQQASFASITACTDSTSATSTTTFSYTNYTPKRSVFIFYSPCHTSKNIYIKFRRAAQGCRSSFRAVPAHFAPAGRAPNRRHPASDQPGHPAAQRGPRKRKLRAALSAEAAGSGGGVGLNRWPLGRAGSARVFARRGGAGTAGPARPARGPSERGL